MARYFRRGLGEQLAELKGCCSLCGGFSGVFSTVSTPCKHPDPDGHLCRRCNGCSPPYRHHGGGCARLGWQYWPCRTNAAGIVADAGWYGGLGVVANAVAASNGALGLSHRLNHQRHVVGVGVRCNAVAKVEYMRSGPKGVHDAQRLAHQSIAARHHMFGC